jgi:hypothetical protein
MVLSVSFLPSEPATNSSNVARFLCGGGFLAFSPQKSHAPFGDEGSGEGGGVGCGGVSKCTSGYNNDFLGDAPVPINYFSDTL